MHGCGEVLEIKGAWALGESLVVREEAAGSTLIFCDDFSLVNFRSFGLAVVVTEPHLT
jgi:hypothetical protein